MSHQISGNALQIYEARYLDEEAKTPHALFKRVSGGNDEYFNLMNDGLFLPNSPTLFNAGKKQGGTLSACFVFDIEDCLLGDWPNGGLDSPFPNSICGTTFKAMAVAKAGGGVGYYLGNIREEGSLVRSTHKRACGIVTVIHWLNGINRLITQGGKRALAQMGITPIDHPDAVKVIHCKDEDPQALSSFNLSMSWRNDWLEKIDFEHLNWTTPTLTLYGQRNEQAALWMEQCRSAWKTGDPGMFFWDTMNKWNATPHLGNINATNPCGETPNLNNEPCNLGSLNLRRFVRRKVDGTYFFDWMALSAMVPSMIRFMDDILDWNVFPHPDITAAAMATRKLGLGVMGYADTLALLHIPYDSQAAVDFGGEVMESIAKAALEESVKLGEKKGPYLAYDEAKSPAWAPKCRNSTRTSIAPTGTISLLLDASSGIEPHYALEWDRTTNEGINLKERIQVWDELNGFVPKVANEIALEWHVKHQAAFQKHTDLGVSKTINLPNSATVADISRAYQLMWQSGCKGGTVFRDGCRSEQVLVSKERRNTYTVDKATGLPEPKRKKLPNDRSGTTHKFRIGGTKGYVTANRYGDGELAEIFIVVDKQGSTLDGFLDAWARTFSTAIQYGTPLTDLIRLHKNSRFEPYGLTGNKEIPNCTSIADYVVRWLETQFAKRMTGKTDEIDSKMLAAYPPSGTGAFCIDCGTELVREGSCMKCLKPGCGYSKC